MAKQAPDLSEFRSPPKQPGQPCWYQRIDLDEERMEKLDAALADTSIKHVKIEEVLERWGVTVRQNMIGRHRNRRCACD